MQLNYNYNVHHNESVHHKYINYGTHFHDGAFGNCGSLNIYQQV